MRRLCGSTWVEGRMTENGTDIRVMEVTPGTWVIFVTAPPEISAQFPADQRERIATLLGTFFEPKTRKVVNQAQLWEKLNREIADVWEGRVSARTRNVFSGKWRENARRVYLLSGSPTVAGWHSRTGHQRTAAPLSAP